MTLVYGQKGQIAFASEEEKYQFIGYLTAHDVSVLWENNDQSGAWGKEGRMTFPSKDVKKHFPRFGYSAGLAGSYDSRLNCNDFVKELFTLGFVKGKNQPQTYIRNNVPISYQFDFDIGAKL